jgi:anti-sigma regulatory factor (Ser/Thr protein kinase)
VVIDADGFGVRFASAAHPPPLLIAPDGSASFAEHPPAPPLGAAERSRFAEWEGELPPGATMLLYTDGLIERRDETIDVGFARLRRAVQDAPANLEQLCSHVLARAPSAGSVVDDVALLAVRRLTPTPALELTLPAEPGSLAVARHRLERWLEQAGVEANEIFALRLAANEAATNAVEHAYGPERGPTFRLTARREGGCVEIEVADSGHWRARRGAQRGLGLDMMERLMDGVEVQRTEEGTTVRMRKECPR